ncbi:MAG TPA: hypothetical protein PKO05_10005 [Thermoanaerobaculia bacterium]|jgi:hypothetical protein|nr:hypothetical protein [Thermoanaerobaculia bacterium]MDI9631829.1 hypothetical protein [Acidobacteriota bacterium]OQC42092.1 MAG: hypothetical protein BWX64_00433 [Acidobacteria bacterium ADurb.Bin051]MBP7813629.1 hypothetical protein [Thermoanaerobaculia bacterium]MBP8844428.1 hypothetical protein [Thermoanaerobaculia bacterium]
MSTERLSYLPIEIRSYLPTGWGLVAGTEPRWDERKETWTAAVYDLADNEWTVRVTEAAAGKQGRLPALKQAIDEVFYRSLR